MIDDKAPLVASSLNVRAATPTKPTLIPFLATVILTAAACLALALHDNPLILASAPAQSSPSATETQQAYLLGRLTFQGVISLLVSLIAWSAFYWGFLRTHAPQRSTSYMIILVAAGLIAGVAAPLAIFAVSHPSVAEARGPVGAANKLNEDYALIVSRDIDIYNANLAATRWTDLTWNGALAQNTDFDSVREMLKRAEALSAAAQAEFETHAVEHQAQLRALLAERQTPPEITGQVLAQSDDQDASYRKSIQLDGAQIVAFGTMVDTLDATQGKWRVEGGKYVFLDSAAKAAFDSALRNFVAAAEAREALNAPQR